VTQPATYYSDDQVTLLLGDALETLRTLPDASVDCVVTSPPYFGLRDYQTDGQYGLEATPAEYVETMRALFSEARRVLAEDGTLWLNLGDSYNSGRSKQPGKATKNLLMIPERVAMALQDDGWILRNKIVWHKTNAMPSPVTDRFSNRYEHLFLFSRVERYWFDLDPIREPVSEFTARYADHTPKRVAPKRAESGVYPRTGHVQAIDQQGGAHARAHPLGRNPGDVWPLATRPNRNPKTKHFATFPIDLPLRCIKAGCKPGGTVLDPFSGSGTTGAAALQLGRKYIGVDLNPDYHELAKDRFAQGVLDVGGAA
jgi:site-specific DNA-methyltransferase (cytosine-N4-specific)